jgi:hypothetical protein
MAQRTDGERTIADAVASSFEPMPAEARAAVRERLLAAASASTLPWYRRISHAALALATGTALLGGVSYAAAASGPGDFLYPVKSAAERTIRSIAPLKGDRRGGVVKLKRRTDGARPAAPVVQEGLPATSAATQGVPGASRSATAVAVPGKGLQKQKHDETASPKAKGGIPSRGRSGQSGTRRAVGRERVMHRHTESLKKRPGQAKRAEAHGQAAGASSAATRSSADR